LPVPIIGRSTNRLSGFGMRISLCLLLAALASVIFLPPSSTSAQEQTASDERLHRNNDAPGFIIDVTDGQQVCQQSTSEESRLMLRRDPSGEMHQITPTQRRTASTQQTGLKIILRGTAQLEGFPQAKDGFLRAAAIWESLISTPITLVIDVDFGPTLFGTPFRSPMTLGGTLTQELVDDNIYTDVRNQLITRATNQTDADFYRSLPTGLLPTDLGATNRLSGPSALFRVIGVIRQVANPDGEAASLGPPPSIGFNSSFNFDFDPTDGITSGRFDFTGTALHEIGHALGFSSNVGYKEISPNELNYPSIWDIFRFRPGVTSTSFTTAERIQSSGGEQIFFSPRSQAALSTGRPNGEMGDLRQASHWKDDFFTGQRIGIMDPSLAAGRRSTITEADLNALATMGYRIEPSGNQGAVIELAHDDGSVESVQTGANGRIVVNRFTPSEYPVTLRTIRIYFAQFPNQPNPTGAQIRLVAFNGPSGGAPPDAPSLLVDQMVTIPGILDDAFIDFDIPSRPQIASGDLYVGFQVPNPARGVAISLDSNGEQKQRSFSSTNNGQTYQGPLTVGGAPRNAMIRAIVGRGDPQTPAPLTIVSAASFQGGKVAPESIAAAFGADLATGVETAATIPLPTIIRRTTVTVRDSTAFERSGSLFFVSPGQINFLIPPGTASGTATVTVTSGDGQISTGTIQVGSTAPGLFAANSNGSGAPAAYLLRAKNSGQQIEEQIAQFDAGQGAFIPLPIDLSPTDESAFLIIFGTGFRGRSNLAGVSVTAGGIPIAVAFAGGAQGFTGLDQINAGPLSRSLAGRGEVDLVVTVDGQTTNVMKISLK
jgi:uncharacterized protein (TIGR03437 family)